MSKPLNGRESSILALLAQGRKFYNTTKFGKAHRDIVLKALKGQALDIGKAILGQVNDNPKINKAANGFISWAKGLGK